jgi:hypothetical protein
MEEIRSIPIHTIYQIKIKIISLNGVGQVVKIGKTTDF